MYVSTAVKTELMALSEKLRGCFRILKEITDICVDSTGGVEATSPEDTIMDEEPKVQTPCSKDAVAISTRKDAAELCIQRVSWQQYG